ncbi:hypothetical protein [Paremcibacter congregatus]|uniref:hypothetical protein n=1 Tax=Paremcibacter congregatus TaxID=2043170 RepID=UPI0030EE2EF7|tara:strand:- start:12365 stop:13708 length:1344 start_codon:yes stop_codon:yes gene_type:complete
MTQNTCFIFKSCQFSPQDHRVTLDYGYLGGARFTETLIFPGARRDFSDIEKQALDKLLHALHLAAGISYYKAFCPSEIRIDNQTLSPEDAAFFTKFYLHGLGEFAVENNLDLRETIQFPLSRAQRSIASPVELKESAVVPIGGGKDSLVSLEIMKHGQRAYRPIAINAGRPILEVIDSADAPAPILIKRHLDPALFTLNDQGAYNGHVPITGILSFIMAFASLLYGYDTVVMSNEQSANEGNMVRDGLDINHQYSKSLAFEQDFNRYVTGHVLAGFRYFSLLRPLSETGIAALFARAPRYFPTFKSCNRNFHIAEGERRYGWCCDCPKCRFVYLALAPFIGKARMCAIFGHDMLDDPAQEDGYRELLGLEGHKPFECVGEIGECRRLLKSLALIPEWRTCYLIDKLSRDIPEPGQPLDDLRQTALRKYPDHNLPADYERLLDDFIGS